MENHTFVEFDHEEAKLLGDLAGIKRDLEDAKRFASRLERVLSTPPFDSEFVDALTTTILVRYARAFTSGVRTTLHQGHRSQLTKRQQGLHERFIAWRNKHIAHSVNPFEQNQVVARFVQETVHQVGIQYVSVQENRVIGLGSQDLVDLHDLIDALLSIVGSEYEREQARLLGFVRSLPLKEVLAGPTTLMPRPGVESVKRSRPR